MGNVLGRLPNSYIFIVCGVRCKFYELTFFFMAFFHARRKSKEVILSATDRHLAPLTHSVTHLRIKLRQCGKSVQDEESLRPGDYSCLHNSDCTESCIRKPGGKLINETFLLLELPQL